MRPLLPRPMPARVGLLPILLLSFILTRPSVAEGQNDWQFPDPYFGILEVEKSAPRRSSRGPGRGLAKPVTGDPAAGRPSAAESAEVSSARARPSGTVQPSEPTGSAYPAGAVAGIPGAGPVPEAEASGQAPPRDRRAPIETATPAPQTRHRWRRRGWR